MLERTAPTAILLMGVAGCGKSTIGRLLSKRLGCAFIEGDEFHPAKNIEKMRAGIPLTDQDRMPWLSVLHARTVSTLEAGGSCVVACSALKEQYRQMLRRGISRFILVYLQIEQGTAEARLAARKNHFFSPSLLQNQFDNLERPTDGITVDATKPPEEIVAELLVATQATS